MQGGEGDERLRCPPKGTPEPGSTLPHTDSYMIVPLSPLVAEISASEPQKGDMRRTAGLMFQFHILATLYIVVLLFPCTTELWDCNAWEVRIHRNWVFLSSWHSHHAILHRTVMWRMRGAHIFPFNTCLFSKSWWNTCSLISTEARICHREEVFPFCMPENSLWRVSPTSQRCHFSCGLIQTIACLFSLFFFI